MTPLDHTELAKLLSEKAKLLTDEPLAPITSFKIGGPAEYLVLPADNEDVQFAVEFAKNNSLVWRVLGSGSNIIVPDQGLQGLTIKFWRNFDKIEVNPPYVLAQAGASMLSVTQAAADKGLSGLEWGCGIPGTVGGAVYMNAGVKNEEVCNSFDSATVMTNEGNLITLSKEDLDFSYRESSLQRSGSILLDARFLLKPELKENVYLKMNRHLSMRSSTQPINMPNCGSVFRNPVGDFAGRLIEQSGLKGFSIGGVKVSEQHANFIVNIGHGTASDVLNLINHIKRTVLKDHNIELQEEVRLIQ
jgi:UDP-N-acetylmuramate dehydrogenase